MSKTGHYAFYKDLLRKQNLNKHTLFAFVDKADTIYAIVEKVIPDTLARLLLHESGPFASCLTPCKAIFSLFILVKHRLFKMANAVMTQKFREWPICTGVFFRLMN